MEPEQASLVLSKIRAHHGNAEITDLQFQCFHEELLPYVTFEDALAAIKEYYANDTTGRWMGAGDINAYVRRSHRRLLPSDRQIAAMAEADGVSGGDEYWQYRRSLLRAFRSGCSPAESRGAALKQSKRPMLSGVESKPLLPSGGGREPVRMGELGAILGTERQKAPL